MLFFLSLKFVLIIANSAGPDEMQHYAAFHLRLHCYAKLPIYWFPVYKWLIESTLSILTLFECAPQAAGI